MRKIALFVVLAVVALSVLSLGSVSSAHADDSGAPVLVGHVYAPDGTPLAGIGVGQVTPGIETVGSPWSMLGEATTDSSGEYQIAVASTFSGSLGFYDTNHVYATEYLGGVQFSEQATPINVTNQTGTIAVPDMVMQPGGFITTTVTNPDGTAAIDVYLMIYALNAAGEWQLTAIAEMEPQLWYPWYRYGTTWQSPALPPGDYRICEEGGKDAAPQCLGDTPSPGTSTPLDVEVGQTVEGNFSLEPGATLTGTMIHSDGSPYAGFCSALFWQDPDNDAWEDVDRFCSDSTGQWNLPNLAPGNYEFGSEFDQSLAVNWPDASTPDPSGIVSVADGQTAPPVTLVLTPPSPAATNTTLSLSSASAPFGQSDGVTATVTVTPQSGTGVPDGAVTLEDFGPNGGVFTLPLVNGTATMSLRDDMGAGAHEFEAHYTGDTTDTFAQSTSAEEPIQIAAQPVDVSLMRSTSAEPFGESQDATVTAHVWVPGTTLVPDGGVTFYIDGQLYNPGFDIPINPLTGDVTIAVPAGLAVGVHTIAANYAQMPLANFVATQTASITLDVTTPPPTVTLRGAVEMSGGHRVDALAATVSQSGAHPAGTFYVYNGQTLVASLRVASTVNSDTVRLTWRDPSTATKNYVVRFVPNSVPSAILIKAIALS